MKLHKELVTQLLIQQPEDPIVFIKQCVQHIVRKRDNLRVILIAPSNFGIPNNHIRCNEPIIFILRRFPICVSTHIGLYVLFSKLNETEFVFVNIDKMTLAKILQEETGICPVTLEDLHALSPTDNTCHCYDANEIAIRMKKMLMSGVLHESGWVLIDIPRNKKEAHAMQRIGIIPTHVIQIIPQCAEDETQEKKDARQYDYKKILRGLREAYANFLIEVEVGTKTIHKLGKDCARLMKVKKHYGVPSLFRIALIGPPESDYRFLAKHISERFNLVYVDLNNILEQACLRETALGEILRLCEHRCGQKVKLEARVRIIEQYVLGADCLKRGWILTGYLKTVEEFKLLDMIATPPNRVIVLKMDAQQTCGERFLNRQCDIITGSKHDLVSCESSVTNPDCKLDVHSSNCKNIVDQNLWKYEENISDIMQYAGETVSVIDAMNERKCVREKLEACLIRPASSAKPRIPQPPVTIDPMNIEFDPDDEPDPSIFDGIRAPEPKYSFI